MCTLILSTELIFFLLALQSLEAALATRPLAVGHNRIYYHTTTMHPIDPAFFDDEDSEAEDAPEWLRQQYQRKVEEITDVNKVSPPLNYANYP